MKKIKCLYGYLERGKKSCMQSMTLTCPFPLLLHRLHGFVITEFIIILFGDIPPLSMIEGAFLKYFGIRSRTAF